MMPTLVAVSHGTSDDLGQAAIARLVAAVRDRLPEVDVRQAFVDVQEPSLASVLGTVGGPVAVVPLLLGGGFHVHVDITAAVEERATSGRPTAIARTLGPDAGLTGLLVGRLHQAGLADDDAVVLAVAGSSDVRARLSADRAAAMLATALRRRVRVGHLGGAGRPFGELVDEARASGARRVIAANYLLAPGHFASRLEESSADLVATPLSGGIHLDPRLLDVVVRRYATASQPLLACAA